MQENAMAYDEYGRESITVVQNRVSLKTPLKYDTTILR